MQEHTTYSSHKCLTQWCQMVSILAMKQQTHILDHKYPCHGSWEFSMYCARQSFACLAQPEISKTSKTSKVGSELLFLKNQIWYSQNYWQLGKCSFSMLEFFAQSAACVRSVAATMHVAWLSLASVKPVTNGLSLHPPGMSEWVSAVHCHLPCNWKLRRSI